MLVNGYIVFILRNIPYCVIYIYIYRYVRFTSYTYVQICRCDLTGQICSTSRKGWGLDGVQPGRIGDSKVHLVWDRLNSGQACQRGSGRRAQHLPGPAGMCFFWRLQYQNHKVLMGFVDVSFSKSNSLCKPCTRFTSEYFVFKLRMSSEMDILSLHIWLGAHIHTCEDLPIMTTPTVPCS